MKGFKEFIMRGNVIDLAVAFVIGVAVAALIGVDRRLASSPR